MVRKLPLVVLLGLALALAAACGPTGRGGDKPGDPVTTTDPNRDSDGDGLTPKQGDCNDKDKAIFPGAPELCDGKDHDCNGITDDICDRDGDGYSVLAGNGKTGGDCNDQDALVGPDAMEIAQNGIDDDCDGQTDNAAAACDGMPNKSDPHQYAAAFELCMPWVISAQFNPGLNSKARDIKTAFGSYTPKKGANFIAISTGVAAAKGQSGYVQPQMGTDFGTDAPNPAPMNNVNTTCGTNDPDPTTVNDYAELKLTLRVPQNAKSFSFQFNFMSAEYPEFVGTEYNDKFLVLLDSKAFKGNVSFDKNNNPITVNAGFFDVCDSAPICDGAKQNTCGQPVAQLNGTGYEDTAPFDSERIGGGTGWLTTTSPVQPGETAVIRFIIFDEGDGIYDSTVLIDNFQWQVEGSSGPITIG